MIVVKYGGTIDRNITQPVIKENEKTDTNYFSAYGLRMLGDRMACREKNRKPYIQKESSRKDCMPIHFLIYSTGKYAGMLLLS